MLRVRHEMPEEMGQSASAGQIGHRFRVQVCRGAMSFKSVQMWRTGVRYELVGVPDGKKTGISDYLKSHRLRRQPVFMIESITIHGRLLGNQQFFL